MGILGDEPNGSTNYVDHTGDTGNGLRHYQVKPFQHEMETQSTSRQRDAPDSTSGELVTSQPALDSNAASPGKLL